MLTQNTAGLYIPHHDYLSINPAAVVPGSPQTITFRKGGPTGVVVATQIINYDSNGNVTSVEVQ